jgi:UDP-N-acetylglucosamine 4,6-dehydratase
MFDETIHAVDRVLVTGGTGTLGENLLAELVNRTQHIRVLSRDEAKQGVLRSHYPGVDWMLGDVRDPKACADAVRDIDIVIHCASLKYVDVSEKQPSEYILTNVNGTLNLINAILMNGNVRQVIGISTDKAANPFNTYGLTKALLEKLFLEAHAYRRGPNCETIFTVCRYGNVVGSRGSVVLKWQELTQSGQPIKVTDPEMTRFFFTVDDALALIDYALWIKEGGVIVSQAMPSCTLGELASLWSDTYEVIGTRPGEKQHEDLLTQHEMPRVRRDGDFFIYTPLGSVTTESKPLEPYTSANARRLERAELEILTSRWRP